MSKAKHLSNQKWATVQSRIAWLVESQFAGNRSALAKAIGFSHTIIARVIGGANPGPRLLDAIVTRLHVDAGWLQTGEGQPFPDDGDANKDRGIPITTVLLPGPPRNHQSLITGEWVKVPTVVSSPSRYWLSLTAAQPIIMRPGSGFCTGDHLLIESDPAKFPPEHHLYEKLCVVRTGTQLRLGAVAYHRASDDTGNAYLDADFCDPPEADRVIVEHVYRHHPDGEVQHLRRRFPADRETGNWVPPPIIRYSDIVGVWLAILHRPLG